MNDETIWRAVYAKDKKQVQDLVKDWSREHGPDELPTYLNRSFGVRQ